MPIKQHHIPRDEAIERFIDKSKTYNDGRFISYKEEVNLYEDLLGLGDAGWDLWTVTYYSEAIGVIRYLKKSGHKVKVINKGNRVIILYKPSYGGSLRLTITNLRKGYRKWQT